MFHPRIGALKCSTEILRNEGVENRIDTGLTVGLERELGGEYGENLPRHGIPSSYVLEWGNWRYGRCSRTRSTFHQLKKGKVKEWRRQLPEPVKPRQKGR